MEEAKKKRKQSTKKSEVEFCKVCRLHHDQGSRHKYFPRHKECLSSLLDRFRSKISDVRFFLKKPIVLRPQEESHNRVWCVFCEEDIVELGSSFTCSKAIIHFASADHLKSTKQFLWKYGPRMDCVDDFRISETDVAKWERKCQSLRSEDTSSCKAVSTHNDIHNKLEFENIDRIQKVTAHHINSQHSNDVIPLQTNTNEYQIFHSGLPGVTDYGSYLSTEASQLPLCTFTPSHLQGNGLGENSVPCRSTDCSGNGNYCTREVSQDKKQVNSIYVSPGVFGIHSIASSQSSDATESVHTEATPLWLDANDGNVLDVQLNQSETTGIQAMISGKNRKLNPKRVGAAWAERRKIEIEIEKKGQAMNYNADRNWLPDFGRVWQSGTRKESRKEFEKEEQKLVKTESFSKETEPIQIQPYISKRVRRENGE